MWYMGDNDINITLSLLRKSLQQFDIGLMKEKKNYNSEL